MQRGRKWMAFLLSLVMLAATVFSNDLTVKAEGEGGTTGRLELFDVDKDGNFTNGSILSLFYGDSEQNATTAVTVNDQANGNGRYETQDLENNKCLKIVVTVPEGVKQKPNLRFGGNTEDWRSVPGNNAISGEYVYTTILNFSEQNNVFNVQVSFGDNNQGGGGQGGEGGDPKPTDFGFNALSNEDKVTGISYRINDAAEWTNIDMANRRFEIDLNENDKIALKLTLKEKCSVDPKSINLSYDAPEAGGRQVEGIDKNAIAAGLVSGDGYVFTYKPSEVNYADGAEMRLQLDIVMSFDHQVKLHWYKQQLSEDEEGNPIYGEVMKLTQQPILEEFRFNGNSVQISEDGIADMGGYVTGSEKNALHFLPGFGTKIEKFYCKSGSDGKFTEADFIPVGENGVYDLELDPAEEYSFLLVEGIPDDYTIIWSYRDSDKGTDQYVENGKVYVDQVVRDGKVLSREKYGANIADDWGGFVTLKRGDVVTLRVVPDYGYQLKSASLNGFTLKSKEQVSTFEAVMRTNFHFNSAFVPASDVTKSESDAVSGASIADGQNAAASGNLSLTVKDDAAYTTDVSTAIVGNDKLEKVASLDVSLENIVSKGNGSYWTSDVTAFEKDITVGLQLKDVKLGEGETITVVRDHEGKLTELQAKYDAATGTISFPTNQFSTYTIVKKSPVSEEPVHVHKLVKADAVEATCTKPGNTLYYKCECGKYFSDAAATKEIKESSWVLPALGHDYKTKIVPATTRKAGYSVDICSRCKEEKNKKTIAAIKSVTLKYESTSFTGKALKPAVTVKDTKGKKIAASNYKVTYKNNKNVGKATVTVTFKNLYKGTVSKTFQINPAKTSITKCTAKKDQITVTWKAQKTQTTGYQLEYSTDKTFKKAVKKVNVSGAAKTSVTVKKLTSNKTYYVRIRTCKKIGKTMYYSEYSPVKKIKTKKN